MINLAVSAAALAEAVEVPNEHKPFSYGGESCKNAKSNLILPDKNKFGMSDKKWV
jgi:hypothetical protein